MITREVKVKNSTGLHARPATMIVQKAASFKSSLSIEVNGKKGNLKSMISILSLGIAKDNLVTVTATGEDQEIALKEIADFIERLEE